MLQSQNYKGKVEEKLPEVYLNAFEKINAEANQELTIVEMNGHKVATFHLSFIQYLTHRGGPRVQIEAARTNADFRGHEIRKKVFEYPINGTQEKGCTYFSTRKFSHLYRL